ncbi:hypothetical protein CC80DRAFT_587999 [Byssothecium circinans]|uniref:Uncharacterized protein n=1 Tax=Byssothecium circinans TaxID=147558 RepID=A0A6A5UH13_9PLEO|nr:hypothetical protein CC80DRAFT_587999 [Byssothecium circinans]
MPMLPRRSLASIVCPSTPFLVPRLLRTPAPRPLALLSRCSESPQPGGLQRPSYATKSKGKGRPNPKPFQAKGQNKTGKWVAVSNSAALRDQLRAACDSRDVKAIMDLYPSLAHLRVLEPKDVRRIAQALHFYARNVLKITSKDIFPFAMQIVDDIMTKTLPPHPWAHVHLLGIFKQCKMYDQGYTFWQWLVDQDDSYVSPAVYGAAIELMAYGGKGLLSDLENIYVDALKRFPGTFAEYHLSPNAILPDRNQLIVMSDMPATLLQGILTARVLSGDWKNAYLALDAGLRLFPTQLPVRCFDMLLHERPLPEGYTALLVACRAGICPHPNVLSTLLKKVRAAMTLSTSLHARTILLRAMANAMYAFLEARGTLSTVHVSSFLNAFDSLLPEKAPGDTFKGEEATLRNTIVTTAHECLSTIMQAGMSPATNTFAALFNLAGRLHVPDLLRVSLKDCETAGLYLAGIEVRTVLAAAGRLSDKALIEEYWTKLVSRAEESGDGLIANDWITFARACKRGGHVDYCREQIHKLDHTLSTSMKLNLTYELENEEAADASDKTFTYMKPDVFSTEMEELKSQFKNIAAVVMSGQPLYLKKTPFYMSLDPSRRPIGTDDDLRTIYNEMTTDPHQPPAPSNLPQGSENSPSLLPESTTGIPLGELRYQNWVSVVQMMDQAQFWEVKNPPKAVRAKPTTKPSTAAGSVHLGGADQHNFPLPLDTLRAHIKQLRAPAPTGAFNFRKVGAPTLPITRNYVNGSNTSEPEPPVETGRQKLTYRPQLEAAPRKLYNPESDRGPRLQYYVGVESDHVAPPKLSRNPLQTRAIKKKVRQHALRLQPSPSSKGEAATAAMESVGSETVKEESGSGPATAAAENSAERANEASS